MPINANQTSISLRGQITSDAITQILEVLQDPQAQLIDLILSESNLNDVMLRRLAAGLQRYGKLQSLDLSENLNITCFGFDSLAKILDGNPHLTVLDISITETGRMRGREGFTVSFGAFNSIKKTHVSFENFMQSVGRHPKLKCLKMKGNQLGEVPLTSLADAVEACTSLEDLELPTYLPEELSWNDMAIEFIKPMMKQTTLNIPALARALSMEQSGTIDAVLTNLSLQGNALPRICAALLKNAVAQARADFLESLDKEGILLNQIQIHWIAHDIEFQHALETNQTLKEIAIPSISDADAVAQWNILKPVVMKMLRQDRGCSLEGVRFEKQTPLIQVVSIVSTIDGSEMYRRPVCDQPNLGEAEAAELAAALEANKARYQEAQATQRSAAAMRDRGFLAPSSLSPSFLAASSGLTEFPAAEAIEMRDFKK